MHRNRDGAGGDRHQQIDAGRPLRVLLISGTVDAIRLLDRSQSRADAPAFSVACLPGSPSSVAANAEVVFVGALDSAERISSLAGRVGADVLMDMSDAFDRRTTVAVMEASRSLGIPTLRFERPCWRRHPLDRWVEVERLDDLPKLVADVGTTALLALPDEDLRRIGPVPGVRTIGLAARPVPGCGLNLELDVDTGPYSLAGERARLERYGIDVIVTRAEGGARLEPLIVAARCLDLPVFVLRRSPRPEMPIAEVIDDALDWLNRQSERSAGGFEPVGGEDRVSGPA